MSYDRVARLAVMLTPRDGDTRAGLAHALVSQRDQLYALFGPATRIRLGIRCDNDPLQQSMCESRTPTSVEGAIEITGEEGSSPQRAAHAGALGT